MAVLIPRAGLRPATPTAGAALEAVRQATGTAHLARNAAKAVTIPSGAAINIAEAAAKAVSEQNKRSPVRRRSSGEWVFRAQATCGDQLCVLKVDASFAHMEVTFPASGETVSRHLRSDSFTIDVWGSRRNAFTLRIFDQEDNEREAFNFQFSDAYCATRTIFTLFVIRRDVSLHGLCRLASACVRGTRAAAATAAFCPDFFDLHAKELERFFPGRVSLLRQLAR